MQPIYTFTLQEKQFEVLDENELALVCELVQDEQTQKQILQQIGDDALMHIIRTNEGLLRILKPLLGRNRFLLIFLISDNLPAIVGSARNLSYIISGIANEVDKVLLVKRMRQRGLEKIIRDATSFSHVLEWIHGEGERIVLNQFGTENIMRVLSTAEEVYDVLHYLNQENKEYLVEIMTFSALQERVRRFGDFILLMRGMTEKNAQEFMKLYSPKEIKNLIDADANWVTFLKKMSETKEAMLIAYLNA